ncbi:MAG: hypothetical protein HQK49_07765 [Oligoflexia bacterium]|nr:hypothetical protein [Oligoflexia bacterium]
MVKYFYLYNKSKLSVLKFAIYLPIIIICLNSWIILGSTEFNESNESNESTKSKLFQSSSLSNTSTMEYDPEIDQVNDDSDLQECSTEKFANKINIENAFKNVANSISNIFNKLIPKGNINFKKSTDEKQKKVLVKNVDGNIKTLNEFKSFLSKGASIRAVNPSTGLNAVQDAVIMQKTAIIEYLLTTRDISKIDRDFVRDTAFKIVIEDPINNTDIAKILAKHPHDFEN